MAKLGIHEIRKAAITEIGKHSGGVRFAELVKVLQFNYPDTNPNTIYTQVSTLHKDLPTEVVKPSRGLFQLPTKVIGPAADSVADVTPNPGLPGPLLEKDFYESFGNWLKDELDEVTHVVPLGGAGIKGKWGTPDVIGVYKSSARDIFKFPTEIIAAEVKTDPQQPVVAFGQAVAYRLFSHRVYIAMPTSLMEEDASRLESLCMLFGIGLVLFTLSRDHPNYTIRLRAQTHAPDAFYINLFAERLYLHNRAAFEKLFG